jgi:hypothetical protein
MLSALATLEDIFHGNSLDSNERRGRGPNIDIDVPQNKRENE